MDLAPKTSIPIAIMLLCGTVTIGILGTGFAINKHGMEANTAFYAEGVQDINASLVGKSYPVITAENHKISLDEEFDPMEWVSATDAHDGNITNKVEVYGTVDNTQKGDYDLRYVVRNGYGLKTEKKIRVIVD